MTDYDIITYVPSLILNARKLNKYMSVHQAELAKTLTPEQQTCLTNALAAVGELLICLVVSG
jgi:hypothetical protein